MSELEVLQAISRAFGSSPDLDEASASAVRWIRAAVGSQDASVRIILAEPDRSLRPFLTFGEMDEPSSLAERTAVAGSRRTSRVELAPSRALVTMPLVSRGELVGILQVAAPPRSIDERWGTLEAVASQVAIVFRNLAHRAVSDSSFEGLHEMAGLAGTMVRSGSPEEALRAAVAFCHGQFGVPSAGWLARGNRGRLDLITARGLGSKRGRSLRGRMRTLRRHDLQSETDRRRAAGRFGEIAGLSGAEAIFSSNALILVGGTAAWPRASFRIVESLLEDVLGHLDVVASAQLRHERLDLGIAWTAHEVRAPLIGALAIIERLLMEADQGSEHGGLLLRSRRQLEQLAGLVDGLLRWAVVGEPLELRKTDLVQVVREAVDACSRDGDAGRVSLSVPDHVLVSAEPDHLRGAIANVVRNALSYSPPETTVSVAVREDNGAARVTVRDRGPGVPETERDSIFDPFMRGAAADMARGGTGLGLFIARRVMQAHGGTIWAGGNGKGATFEIELPRAEEGSPSGR
jgi:signal transduction histidine kinase